MRVLFATGTPASYMAPPCLGDEQVVCGPDWNDERGPDGRWLSLRTPLGEYDLAQIAAKLPASQQPDVVVCLVDASWRNLPRNWGAFRVPKVLLVADTHHMGKPITGMLRYAASEPFDRIVFLYDRHHVPIFRAAGLQNLHWFPGLTFPHNDKTVRSANREERVGQIAFVGQAGRFHPRRGRLLAALGEHRLPVAHKPLPQRAGLNLYGSSLVGFNASLNGDLNLRIFEALASGSMLLTDRLSAGSGLSSLWREGRELITYTDAGDLVEHARHYLDHPAEAREIGRAGATWFKDHFDAARRRSAFLRLAVDGQSLPEFEVSVEAPLRIHYPSDRPGDNFAALEVYESIQELHQQQETVRVSLDATVPADFARLCETLPRVLITRDASLSQGERPDWRVVGASAAVPSAANGVPRLWCWDLSADPKSADPATPVSVGRDAALASPSRRNALPSGNGKTLLLYSDEPNPHGVAQYNHAILLALVRAGWTVCSAHPQFESPLLESQREAGIRHYWTTWNWGPRFVRSMIDNDEPERILAAVEPDLVVFSDCWPISNIAAKHAVIKRDLPFVVVCHSGDLAPGQNFPASLKVVAQQFARARAVVSVAESSLSVLRRHYGLAPDKGRVIFNGRPPVYFTAPDPAARARLRGELNLPAEAMLCFTAARFDAAKGYQFQLAAIKRLVAEAPGLPVYFAWAGTGHLLAEFTAAIAEAGLQERIRLLGHQWNISDWLAAADVFVLTTMLEAMPLSVLEAMAKGVPVVATAVGGIPEELGDTGKLLPDPNLDPGGTVLQLVGTLKCWAADPALRQRIGAGAKQRAERLFREETMIETTLAVFDGVSLNATIPETSPPAVRGQVEPAIAENPGSVAKSILVYTDESTGGGVAHYNHAILCELVRRGWRVFGAQPPNATPLLEAQKAAGITHRFLSYEPRVSFERSFVDTADAERVILPVRPDLIYFSDCSPVSNVAAKHVAISNDIPFVSITHSGAAYLADRFPNCLGVVKKQFAQAREAVTVSNDSLAVLRHSFGLAVAKGVVIHNGRPRTYFVALDAAERSRIRAELGVPYNAVVCFTSARFDQGKGYQYQLLAIKYLQDRKLLGPLYFVWAGDGPIRPDMEAEVKGQKLQDRVRFLGERWDVPKLLGAADIFVFTSSSEAMPLCVLEAMAQGLPVAATSVGGIPEELGDTGHLLPDPNIDAMNTVICLVEILKTWAADPTLRQTIGREAKLRAERLFREETMIETTLALLDRAAGPTPEVSLQGVGVGAA